MLSSESIDSVATALAKFQAGMTAVAKVKPGQAGGAKFKYAPLEEIVDTIREPLAKQGLSYTQPIVSEDGNTYLETYLIHESGQWIGSRAPVQAEKQTLQGLGSGLTYMRRYALSALLGLVADEDDDGQAAERGAAVSEARSRRNQPPAKPAPLCEQIIVSIKKETDPEKMGDYSNRIKQREAEGKLSPEDAQECLSQVASRTAELVSQAAAKPATASV